MKLRKLITTKAHKYGTRHLTAGDEYEVPPRHAIALVAGKKARFADKPMSRRAAERSSKTPQEAFIKYMGAGTITGHVGEVTESDDSIAGSAHGVGAMTSDAAIDRLRLEATQLGIDIDRRWGVARLQHEIAQAKR